MIHFLSVLVGLLVVVGQAKLLGERTRTNFPKPWAIGTVAHPHDQIFFILALKQRNLDLLEQKFWAVSTPGSPDYRNFLAIDEITAMVAPEHKDVGKVMEWLRKAGVLTQNVEDFGDSLRVRTTVGVGMELFDTEFYYFHHNVKGHRIIRQLGQYSLPPHVEDYIDFVSGISEFPVPRYNSIKSSPNTGVTIAPQSLNVFYQVPSTAHVRGNSSAGPIEWDDQYFSPGELAKFSSLFGQKISPVANEHIVGGNNGNNPQIEATLDIQYLLAVSPAVESWFWIEKDGSWLYGWATHFFATPHVPLVCSISYGWNEEDQCEDGIGAQECSQLGVDSKGYVARVNTEFQKIGLRGVSLLSASGDSGANGRTDPSCSENHLNPPFPGASPFITAVGATQITDASGVANLPAPPPGCKGRNCASGGEEVAVSFNQAHFASGGGFSFVAGRPAYQNKAVTSYLASGVKLPPSTYYQATGRGFPDVAALGSAILIFSRGNIETVGGTSASCPIFAGVVSLLNDYVITKTGKPLGFLNPLLYKMWEDQPNTFHDIIKGDNVCTENGCSSNCKGFLAENGWDPVTGLGSPNYTNMLAYIQKTFNIE